MIKYTVLKAERNFWKKKYLWVAYTDEYGKLNSGWAWTHTGACNEAEFYIDKIQDGRYFK